MSNHEWRVRPLIRTLPDNIEMLVFVVIRAPIIASLMALIANPHPQTQALSRLGISAFLVLHGLFHFLFVGYSDYEFSSLLSEILIFN